MLRPVPSFAAVLLLLSALACQSTLLRSAAAQSGGEQPKVKTQVLLSADKLTAGQSVPFAVKATIAEGWHVNAQPPSQEFLIPIAVKVYSKQGTKLVEMLYPKGHVEPSPVGQLSIYEGEVYLFGTLDVPAAAAGATEELIFETSYQTCSDDNQCLAPAKKKITGKIAIVPPGTPVKRLNAATFAKRARLQVGGTVIKSTTTR